MQADQQKERRSRIKEIVPKMGVVIAERGPLAEVLCKPKILPLKSAVLERLIKIEAQATEAEEEQQ